MNTPACLTPEERDAVLAALDVGYFDVPRLGTLSEVAETVGRPDGETSEHLRRGTAKLVRTNPDLFGESRELHPDRVRG